MVSIRTATKHVRKWGSRPSISLIRANRSHIVSSPLNAFQSNELAALNDNFDLDPIDINQDTTEMRYDVDMDGPPILIDDVGVTTAYVDFLPDDIGVSVDTEELNQLELNASSAMEGLSDFHNESDDAPSTHGSCDDDDDAHEIPDLDLMLALRRWNIEVHNSRESMSRLLAILQDAGHVDLPKDWRWYRFALAETIFDFGDRVPRPDFSSPNVASRA